MTLRSDSNRITIKIWLNYDRNSIELWSKIDRIMIENRPNYGHNPIVIQPESSCDSVRLGVQPNQGRISIGWWPLAPRPLALRQLLAPRPRSVQILIGVGSVELVSVETLCLLRVTVLTQASTMILVAHEFGTTGMAQIPLAILLNSKSDWTTIGLCRISTVIRPSTVNVKQQQGARAHGVLEHKVLGCVGCLGREQIERHQTAECGLDAEWMTDLTSRTCVYKWIA